MRNHHSKGKHNQKQKLRKNKKRKINRNRKWDIYIGSEEGTTCVSDGESASDIGGGGNGKARETTKRWSPQPSW